MSKDKRQVVIPSQYLGDIKENKAGRGVYIENGKIYSETIGVLNQNSGFINVTPLKGRYDPIVGDFVIGTVEEALSSSWLVDINAPYPALLHVNEVPWRVDFGETEKYLNRGDSIMAKVIQVDQEKKLQITLKDNNLQKINNGYITNIEPTKVPRLIGKKGSMISILKKYTRCRIFVGKNGSIWIHGDEEGIEMILVAIKKIEKESLSYGLTNRIDKLLKNESMSVH